MSELQKKHTQGVAKTNKSGSHSDDTVEDQTWNTTMKISFKVVEVFPEILTDDQSEIYVKDEKFNYWKIEK